MDFKRVKEAVRMEDVLRDYSIPVSRGWAVCPFHTDRHPSLKVYNDGYYCFSCGAGGDVITFVARMEHVTNAQAAAKLMAQHGISAETSPEAHKRLVERRKAEALQYLPHGVAETCCAPPDALTEACSRSGITGWTCWTRIRPNFTNPVVRR